MKKIILHHGSPGSENDFSQLIKDLKNNECQSYDRLKKKSDKKYFEQAQIQIGYSFGCVKALKYACKSSKTELVIFISPFLFPKKAPGALMKTLLSCDAFTNYALPFLAKKSLDQMLVNSSHPMKVPDSYRKDAKLYHEPKRLKSSILEKEISKNKILKRLQELASRDIPVLIINGEDDLTSTHDEQIAPLLGFKNVQVTTLKKAGHALLWTHREELAKKINEMISQTDLKRLGYFQGVDQNNNVASFLREHVQQFPSRNILTWVNPEDLKNWNGDLQTPLPHQSIKVAELDHLVSILASEFKNLGINFGDRVILFLPMSLYMYASMFALQKMGAIPTFLDSWARRDQMGASAQVAAPTAMISADRAYAYLQDVTEIAGIKIKIVAGPIQSSIQYAAQLEKLLAGKTRMEITPVEKEHTALITFTTGSSGTPKGADRSHRFLAAQHYALNRHLPYQEGDRDLPVFPIFSLNNLAAGVETIIPAIDVGSPAPSDARVLYAQMKSAGVTCTTLSPSLFNALAQYCLDEHLNLDFLKRIVTGGAPISRDDVARMKSVAKNAEILVLYGSTEVEPMAHIEATEMLSEVAHPDLEIVEAGVNVGHLDDGLKYKFIKINKDIVMIDKNSDWKKIEVEPGEVGELIVAGEHVCEKYFNNEEAFFRAKIRDEEGVVWHRTGDLGKLDEKKNLWIVGRVHNAILRKEQYFFPVRAEIILKKFSFVHKAAFLGIEDAALNEKTFAVFSTLDQALDIEASKKEIKRVLEKNQFIVDEVMHVEDIPMDPRHHSKVEYGVLKKTILGMKANAKN